MKKTIIAILLTVFMIIPLLCGCGDNASDGSDAPATNESGTESVPEESVPAEEASDAKGEPVAEVKRKTYKSVILIGIDGAGAFVNMTETPNMDKIFGDGVFTECLTATPTISAQCWGSMLTGVTPTMHGHTNDTAAGVPSDDNAKYPTVFKTIKEQLPDAALAAFCNWTPIYDGIIEHNLGVTNKNGNDSAIKNQTVEYLKTTLPAFMFLQLDEVDAAGHSSGYGSKAHLDTITRLDGYVGEIYDALKESGNIDDVLFMAVTDHGGFGTGHGGQTDEERYVFCAASGETVAQSDSIDMTVTDIPAIVAYALGIEANENWVAHLPAGMFKDNMTPESKPVFKAPVAGVKETPQKGSEGHISDFLDESKIKGLFTFDKTPKADGLTTKVTGSELYYDGIYGQSLILTGSNYVSCEDLKFGTDSFSIACWVNLASTVSDPVIFSNKDWGNGKLNGFVLSSRQNDFKFNVGDNGNRMDVEYAYPESHVDNWFHIILVADRQAERIYMYVNFELIGDSAIPDELKGDSFDSSLPFNIGADGKGGYAVKGNIDDLIIYEDAMTKTEVEKLSEYYSG